MIFNTIISGTDNGNFESEIEQIKSRPGILIINGNYFSTNTYCPLIISQSEDLINEYVKIIKRNESEKLFDGMITINYAYIDSKIERLMTYYRLVTNMQPVYNHEKEISKFFNEITLRNITMKQRSVRNITTFYSDEEIKQYSIYNNKINKGNFYNFTNRDIKDNASNSSGIYFIYNRYDELMYIGKAERLACRLLEHLNGNTNTRDIHHNFKKFKFIKIDMELLYNFEHFYINFYKPVLNVCGAQTFSPMRYDEKYNYYRQNMKKISDELRDKYTKREIIKNGLLKEFDNLKYKIMNL